MHRATGRQSRRRSAKLALAAAGAAAVLAGCGGSKPLSVASIETGTSSSAVNTGPSVRAASSSSPPSQVHLEQSLLKYARCMRAHGVPDFPDPSPGGGFAFNPATGVDPSAPAFKTAQLSCEKYLDLGSGLAPGTTTHPAEQWLARMVKAARCMRRHGLPNFPDPTTTVPAPKVLGGAGVISNIEGAVFVFPAATVNPQTPLYTRAAKACGFPLHNH
jgi:hypothetical protein